MRVSRISINAASRDDVLARTGPAARAMWIAWGAARSLLLWGELAARQNAAATGTFFVRGVSKVLGLMQSSVLGWRDNFQIFQAIIELVTVAVMDMLVLSQGTTERFRHDPAMLRNLVALHDEVMVAVQDRAGAPFAFGRFQRAVFSQSLVVFVAQSACDFRSLASFDRAATVSHLGSIA
jgi:hypothetical protein